MTVTDRKIFDSNALCLCCAVFVPHVCVGGRLGGQTWGNTEVEKHTETEIGRNSRSSNSSSSDSATVTVPTDFQFSFVSFCARGESRRRRHCRHRHRHCHRRWARKKFLIFCANLRLICAAFALLLILPLLLIAVSYFPL